MDMNNKNTKLTLSTPLIEFWNELNDKLLANPKFLGDLGDVYSDVLYFLHPRGTNKSILDFTVFDAPSLKADRIATITLDGIEYHLSSKEYAKIAVVLLIDQRNSRSAKSTFNMLSHLIGLIVREDFRYISNANIDFFLTSFLTESIDQGEWFNRLSPPSYGSSFGVLNIVDCRFTLEGWGVTGVISPSLTKKKYLDSMSRVCKSVMDTSLSEYKKGGSFNLLTLEVGQYYIDHMKWVYEEHFFYGYICNEAINTVTEKMSLLESPSLASHRNVLMQTIANKYRVSNSSRSSREMYDCDSIHYEMKSALFQQYSSNFEKFHSLKEDNICKLVEDIGLDLRFDSVEVIRVLMLQRFYPFDCDKSPEDVWRAYLLSLEKTEINSVDIKTISVEDIYSRMSKLVSVKKLKKKDFFNYLSVWLCDLLGGEGKHTFRKLKEEINRINSAATSLIVAWLGYRKSEFGFPLSAISVESNLDILDHSYVPFRFKLLWVVPKTNGKTKINREITSQCYLLASQLNDLFKPNESEPCLYSGLQKNQTVSNVSGNYIDMVVKRNWPDFVENYKPFREIQYLESLAKTPKSKLTSNEANALYLLQSKYEISSHRFQHLKSTHESLLTDLLKIKCTGFFHSQSQIEFKKALLEFKAKGEISNNAFKEVVDNYLSDETKLWIRSEDSNLDQKGMYAIGRELCQDVKLPIPHAFRHIWAEAVLNRYQGDVGAVVRHQFCHMDDSFFMAYLRDKEVKTIVAAARIRVTNSIVDSLLLDAEKEGRRYIGGFSRFVKKSASLTQALTKGELRNLRDRIADRVISIQPSHFATCIPREGTENIAKCSEMGEMMPHNAKPEFCLGCINAIVNSDNIKGIWITVQPFVKECLDDEIMGFMVQSHLPTLRSAYQRINELQPSFRT